MNTSDLFWASYFTDLTNHFGYPVRKIYFNEVEINVNGEPELRQIPPELVR